MKKMLILSFILIALIGIFINICPSRVYASEAIDNKTESTILEMEKSQLSTIKDYQEKYNSESYGLVAYILHVIQFYSIPFCFLGIAISIMFKVILGARHLESSEKGLGMIVAIVTLTIICQVLPLIFAVVVKLGKE